MKKSLMMLGVAAIALASCTNEEVMNVADSRAIGFNGFVGNTTKSVTDINTATLTKFFVFGDYADGASVAYANTEVTGTQGGSYSPANPAYWQEGQTYQFAAYSNGNEGLSNDDVTFKNGVLTISNYAVNDAKDLIVAGVADVAAPAKGEEKSVNLTFNHMLSKVKFTFSTNAVPEAFRMEVSNLKFTAIKTGATCVITDGAITTDWTGTDGEYTVTTLSDYAVEGGKKSTEDILVIPQANAAVEASFTVTIYDQATDEQIATNDFTASLNSTEWTEGYVYNYTATINPDQIDGQLKPITFTVDKVEDWKPEAETPVTPTPQP